MSIPRIEPVRQKVINHRGSVAIVALFDGIGLLRHYVRTNLS